MRPLLRGVSIGLVAALALIGAYSIGKSVTVLPAGAHLFAHPDTSSLSRAAYPFVSSIDPQVRTKAVYDLKSLYVNATSSIMRAHIVNALVGMMHSAHESYVFDAVFDGEPFSKLLDPSGAERSITNLTRYSLSIHPTAYATQTTVFEDSLRIRILTKNHQRTAREESELASHVAAIKQSIAAAKVAIEKDVLEADSADDAIRLLASYYQWQGHLTGELIQVQPEYLDASLKYLRTALSICESLRKSDPDDYLLDQQVATIHFSYIRYTKAAPGGFVLHPEVLEHLRRLLEMLKKEPQRLTNLHFLFQAVRAYQHGDTSMPGMADHDPSSLLHKELLENQVALVESMAQLSPEAAAYLKSQGIEFK